MGAGGIGRRDRRTAAVAVHLPDPPPWTSTGVRLHCSPMTRTQPARPRFQPAADVLSGDTADIYFERSRRILAAERLDPVVTMEIFGREHAILCGAEESLSYLREILGNGKDLDPDPIVESLHDGDRIAPKEVV